MRPLVLAEQLDQPATGIGRYVDDALAGLVAAGAEPWVACRTTGAERAEELGVPARRLLVTAPSAARATLEVLAGRGLRAAGADVVHGTRHVVPLVGAAATALTVYDMVAFAPPAGARALRRALLPLAHRATVRRATMLLPISDQTATTLLTAHPDLAGKVHTVPVARSTPLLDAEPAAVDDLDGRCFALHVGDLDPRKNTALLVDLWPQVAGSTGATLVLAGARHRGSVRPPGLDALIADGRAVDLGRVSDGTLRWLYDHARVAVVCSASEGFGYPARDALLLGCPLVSSPVPAVAGTTEGVVIRDPGAPATWVPPLVDALGRARSAPPPPRRADPAELGRRLLAAYDEALRRHRDRRR